MAEVNEANTVLSDPEKRAAYDAMGSEAQLRKAQAPRAEAAFAPARLGSAGLPLQQQGRCRQRCRFQRLFLADVRPGRTRAPQPGAQAGAAPDMRGQDQHASIELDLQDSYSGAIRSLHLRATVLDEQGIPTYKDKELQISIPRGVREGQMIRLAGQGNPGLGKGGPGDLLLEVHFRSDPRWWSEGKDVTNACRWPLGGRAGRPRSLQDPGGRAGGDRACGLSLGTQAAHQGQRPASGRPRRPVSGARCGVSACRQSRAKQAYAEFAKAFPSFDARSLS